MRGRNGFVLIEVLVVLIISSVVLVALLGGLVALVRGMQPQSVVYRGEMLPIAPTFGAFPSAVRLHEVFSNRVASARAVYVFGGRHVSISNDAAVAQPTALQLSALPTIGDFSAGLPMTAKAFYDTYGSSLGETVSAPNADDFSVVVVGPDNAQLAVTCFVQVHRSDVSISDGSANTSFIRREATLWEIGAAQPLRYAFAERPTQSGSTFSGAVHTWLRFDADSARQEEGPACVVFPDPWVYGGSRGKSDDIPPFSRFSYFLAVSP